MVSPVTPRLGLLACGAAGVAARCGVLGCAAGCWGAPRVLGCVSVIKMAGCLVAVPHETGIETKDDLGVDRYGG